MTKGERNKRLRDIVLKLDEARTEADTLVEDLQSQFDEMTERQQEGVRGQEIEATIDLLEDAAADIESAHSAFEDTLNG